MHEVDAPLPPSPARAALNPQDVFDDGAAAALDPQDVFGDGAASLDV